MEYEHIGWCKEDNHDKVWGIISVREVNPRTRVFVTFWGRRGYKLHFKVWEGDDWSAYQEFRKKERKGYKSIPQTDLDQVYPGFEEEMRKTAAWATLLA